MVKTELSEGRVKGDSMSCLFSYFTWK